MKKYLTLLTSLLCVTTALAEDYYVNTDGKLREAIANNYVDITVRNGSTLNLNGGTVKGGWGGDGGGIVKAYGGNYATGIGGGDSMNGADLTIKSSIVDKQKSISII